MHAYTIAVIGTGTWGCALATILHQAGERVLLWGRRRDFVEQLQGQGRHPRLNAGEHAPRLPADLRMSSQDADCAAADLWIWAVPTQHSRALARRLAPQLKSGTPVISVSKGLEQGSLLRVSEVLSQSLPPHLFACLSGPSHAEEVITGQPAGLLLAGPQSLTISVQELLNRTCLRVYRGSDVMGVELAGALKNVIAIAAGCVDHLQLGDNILATLVTRGLAEMRRLGRACGCQDATFAGLAGIGDLLTTCYSRHGRNRALGTALAAGESRDSFCARTATIPEGAWTARAAVTLGQSLGVELPIASQVAAVLDQEVAVATAIERLISRVAGEEDI